VASSNRRSAARFAEQVEDQRVAIRTRCIGIGALFRVAFVSAKTIDGQPSLMMAGPVAFALAEAIRKQLADVVTAD
jgi:hypothetical protein